MQQAIKDFIRTHSFPAEFVLIMLYVAACFYAIAALANGKYVVGAGLSVLLVFSYHGIEDAFRNYQDAVRYRYLRDAPDPKLWAKLEQINDGTHDDPTIDAMTSSAEAWDYEVDHAMWATHRA